MTELCTRVVLCDDHRLFVDSFALALATMGFAVVGIAHTPDDCRGLLGSEDVDVCVVDRWFPQDDGLELVAAIVAEHPGVKVLVVSGSVDPTLPSAAALAGASGFASKEVGVDRLADAIRRVRTGQSVDDRCARRSDGVEIPGRLITKRERAVLERLVQGRDTATLARELGISYATARTHIQNLLSKLGVHSKLELVALAVEQGLVSTYGNR